MKVKLKRLFFARGTRFRAGVRTMDDDFFGELPRDATIACKDGWYSQEKLKKLPAEARGEGPAWISGEAPPPEGVEPEPEPAPQEPTTLAEARKQTET